MAAIPTVSKFRSAKYLQNEYSAKYLNQDYEGKYLQNSYAANLTNVIFTITPDGIGIMVIESTFIVAASVDTGTFDHTFDHTFK